MAEVIEYAQKIGEDGFYLKVDKETGEVVKKKTTPGPYKGIPIYRERPEEPEEEVEILATVPPKVLSPEKEEALKKEVRKVNKVEEKPQRVFISLDDSIEKIVSLDQEGADLFFEDEPGKFREIPEEELGKLHKINRERYQVSFDMYQRRVREREHPEEFKTPGITVNPTLTTARARLRVEGKRPGFEYCWKAPHELISAARLGYRIARHPGLQTFANEGDEVHKVAAFGEDELILTEVPKETRDAILKAHSDKSRKRVETVEKSGAAEIRQAGGIPFDPKKARSGLNWGRLPEPNSSEQ